MPLKLYQNEWACVLAREATEYPRVSKSLEDRRFQQSGKSNRRYPESRTNYQRSIELPELAVPSELRYFPPGIPPHEWRFSHTPSMPRLHPVAHHHALQRRPSNTPPPLRLRGARKPLPPILGSPAIRRKSLKRKVPSSYVDACHECILDGHMRKIEVGGILRRESRAVKQSIGPRKCQMLIFRERHANFDDGNILKCEKRVMKQAHTTSGSDRPAIRVAQAAERG
jgi:hypothetical protein